MFTLAKNFFYLFLFLVVAALSGSLRMPYAQAVDLLAPQFEYGLEVTSSSSLAGATPTLSLGLNAEDGNSMEVRTARLATPPGLVGDPWAVSACLSGQAEALNCPPSSRVGSIDGSATAKFKFTSNAPQAVLSEFQMSGDLYNGVAQADGSHHRINLVIYPVYQRVELAGNVCKLNTSCSSVRDWEDISVPYPQQADRTTADLRAPSFRGLVGGLPARGYWATRTEQLKPTVTVLAGKPVVLSDDIELQSDFSLEHRLGEIPRQFTAAQVSSVQLLQYRYDAYMSGCGERVAGYVERMRQGDFTARDTDPNCYFEQRPTYDGVAIELDRVRLVLDGAAGSNGRHFITNPTGCGSKSFDATLGSWPEVYGGGGSVVNYTAAGVNLSNTLDVTGCPAALPFGPALAAKVEHGGEGQAPDLEISLRNTAGHANIQGAKITLPPFAVNLAGLSLCDEPLPVSACPAGSAFAAVRASSPLLEQDLTGNAYLRKSSNGRIGITIALRGSMGKGPIDVTFDGEITIGDSGIAVTFKDGSIPDLPVSSLAMTIKDGGGFLRNPKAGCYDLTGEFTGWSGAMARSSSSVEFTAARPRPSLRLSPKYRRNRVARLDVTVTSGSDENHLKSVRIVALKNIRFPKTRSVTARGRRGTISTSSASRVRVKVSRRRLAADLGAIRVRSSEDALRRVTFKIKRPRINLNRCRRRGVSLRTHVATLDGPVRLDARFKCPK